MATVHQFTQYLFALNHQANAARFAWFNFCKNHCEGSIGLDVETVNRFLRRALSHPYWQTQRALLAEEVQSTLENFLYKKVSEADRQNFKLTSLINAALVQVVPVDDPDQLVKIIDRQMRRTKQNSKFKVIHDGKKQAIAICILPDNTLEVMGFDNLTFILNGELLPLTQDLILYYDDQLELSTRHIHHISVAPFTTARFIVNSHQETRISGSIIKDHSFQRYDVITAQLLKSVTRIFYPIKRIEHFYINPKSEPHYQELTSYLERNTLLIRGNHPDSFTLGKNAIERGKMALDSLYPGDKHLGSLIKELESILIQRFGPMLEQYVNNTDGKGIKWENSKKPEKYGSTVSSRSAGLPVDEGPTNL